MKVLINYSNDEKKFVPFLGAIVKENGWEAMASSKTINISHLPQLKKVGIDAVVCANTESLQELVQGLKSQLTLDNFRGSVLQYQPPVLVVNSLAHIKTVTYGEWLLRRDLQKIRHIKEPIYIPTFTVLETEAQFIEAEEIISNAILLSIDIETDQLARITCVSFTALTDIDGSTYSCVIPFHDFGQDHWTEDASFILAIHYLRVFCKNDVPKIMFNNGYDASYLIRYGAEPNNLVIDVMGLAHSQWIELPKTLDFVLSLHDPHYIQWKLEAAAAKRDGDIKRYWGYCVKDSFNTLKALLLMWPSFPQYAIRNYQQQYKYTFPCLYCAFEGVKVNAAEKTDSGKKAIEIFSKARKDLQTMADDPNFNPNSPKQVATLLYDIIGARQIRERSTAAEILDALGEQHPLIHRVAKDITTYREEAKAFSTYFNFKEINGRLLYNIGPFATDSARFNSRGSNFYVGTQIQNIPDYAKGMLVADDGFILFEADNSKSEARLVAYDSKCERLIKALEDPERDFYKLLATIFFGIPYDKVTKELRDKVIKRVIHGKNYMMGANTFIETVTVSQLIEGARLLGYPLKNVKEFAQYLLNLYDSRFPEVSQNYTNIQTEILTTGRMVSALGYTRIFFGNPVENHNVLRAAVAHKPQNLSVGILNKGFWKVYKIVLKSKGAVRLKAQIHDSNFGQVRKDKIDYYKQEILAAMYNPVQIHGRTVVIPVEWKQGQTWSTLQAQ